MLVLLGVGPARGQHGTLPVACGGQAVCVWGGCIQVSGFSLWCKYIIYIIYHNKKPLTPKSMCIYRIHYTDILIYRISCPPSAEEVVGRASSVMCEACACLCGWCTCAALMSACEACACLCGVCCLM